MSIFEKANPSRQGCLVPQSELVTLALKPYQLASVSWMSDIEECSGRGQTAGSVAGAGGGEWLCSHVMKCQTFQSSLLFDVINNRVLCEPVSPDSRLPNFSLRVKGGILADEMGLGKTVTLIGLFVHNSPSHIPRIPSRQAVLEGSLLECRANLVIAPSHLTKQWQDELEANCPSLQVIVITTKVQHEKVSYLDVLNADVVIVSVQFILTNKHFLNMPAGHDAAPYLYCCV